MRRVTGRAYRFERERVIRDVGSDKILFVKEQVTDSPRSAARAFPILLVLSKKLPLSGC